MTNKNELQTIIADIGDSVYDALCGEHDRQAKNYDFETEDDYAPYGDTEVFRGSFITDESMDKFADSFKESMSIDAILEVLKTDDDFCSAVNKTVEYIAKNREV